MDQEREHVDLALGVVGLERDDVAAGVVEERVDAQRDRAARRSQRRAVADVAVPERVDAVGLPAQARTLELDGRLAKKAVSLSTVVNGSSQPRSQRPS